MSTYLLLYFFQAIGRSTGAHGAFRDYQIDAVTLNMFASGDLESSSYQIDLFTRYGRSVFMCSFCHDHLHRFGEREALTEHA
jgi:hypothetical protein